jgi:signal transduction histidine kinase/ActR/RegA family two-component response regulator
MPVAFAMSFAALIVNLMTAVAHFAISRAPGWRVSRAFAAIAGTAALYCLGNLFFNHPGQPDAVYRACTHWNYFWGHLHVLAWWPFALGGPRAEWLRMPGWARAFTAASLVVAGVFAATGWHFTPAMRDVIVEWAHVHYRYTTPTVLGEWYGNALFLTLTVPFLAMVRRWRRGESDLGWMVAGFAFFILCSAIEVMVSNGVIEFLSPADLGFLAVVIPTSVQVFRRFIRDAGQLRVFTARLADEVRDRDEALGAARHALVEQERHAALGRLAAGVGHEINNPLTYAQLALSEVEGHLGRTAAPTGVHEALGHAREGLWRIQKVVEGLRSYTREPAARQPHDPEVIAQAALRVAGPQLRHLAAVRAEHTPAPAVLADEPRLVQALVNLLTNAAQAVARSGGAGGVTLRSAPGPGGRVLFEVEDDGPGIPADLRSRVLEPYFTTRGPEGGTGLGLFITRGIIAAHEGELAIEDRASGGTRVRVLLPATDRTSQSVPPPAPASASFGRRLGRVLVVDDEPLVARLLATALADEWEVVTAAGGLEALPLLARQGFDAVLCDIMMPGMDGIALADEVGRRQPGLRARMLFLSGGAVTEAAAAFLARPDVASCAKPLDLVALRAWLRAHATGRPSALVGAPGLGGD